MSRCMTLDSILHDESENMAASIELRMCGPAPTVEQPFDNIVPLAALESYAAFLRRLAGKRRGSLADLLRNSANEILRGFL